MDMLNIRSKINILIFMAPFTVAALQAGDAQIRRQERHLDPETGIKVSRSDNKLNELTTEVGTEVRNLKLALPTASEELALYLSNQRALNFVADSEAKAFVSSNNSQDLEHTAKIGLFLARHIDEDRRDINVLQEKVALISQPKLTYCQMLKALCCCK